VRAAERGARVGIVDDNFHLGGQIWRQSLQNGPVVDAADWIEKLQTAHVEILAGTRIFDQLEDGVLLAERSEDLHQLRYDKLILATGARERFLPFPGWTLPNVMGAGGLQAMVKSGLPISGKRVVVAGTGPLLLAVAAYLRKHGAQILMLCEQASWSSLARFSCSLLGQSGKLKQALQLKKELGAVPLATDSWPIAAEGREVLEILTISRHGKPETLGCDYLACGFHLVPNTELASLLGCQLHQGWVQVDDFQRTTVPRIFCAGEPTGVGGVELAVVEGQIAGLATGERTAEARQLFAERKKLRRFADAVATAFQLRPELRHLPAPETIVCRCEDVPYSRLRTHHSWRASKLQTRCGMGPCQGRICGPATEFLFNWNPDSVRPPVFPARVESLAMSAAYPEPQHVPQIGGQR
jgi:NADPH-dependent 2,4-dienoyl-CoA reductase/sulfur reductase-like enzyme